MSNHPSERLFVGLIPDGHRRKVAYDPSRYFDVYKQGAEIMGDILRLCIEDQRVGIFAVWGSSEENIRKRPELEQDVLNAVFHHYLNRLETTIGEKAYCGVQVVHLGNPEFVDPSVYERVTHIARQTRERNEKTFALCLGYGSHDEMRRAVQLSHDYPQVDWRTFLDLPQRSGHPYSHVDLMVRTGTDPANPYTSGYLLPYQGSGTRERYVPECLPDFSADGFRKLIDEYSMTICRRGA